MENIEIGNWVKDKLSNRIFKVARIGKDSFYSEGDFKSVKFEKAERWKPVVEELCLFFNSNDGIKVLSKFYAKEHDGYTESIEFKNYKFCIPFICEVHSV